ncbi:MAG: hypothetical protein JWM11_2446 [Planctomycetaceae bacterium]|nr:hypothetical protein [Planctomycetaceae bacterium]
MEQTACIRDIFRHRSELLAEDEAIQAMEKITGELNRGYALLGIADGRLIPSKK